jgi:uncharacterized protein GlcG (DUF336 family)
MSENITLEQADRVIAAGIAQAAAIGVPSTISVLDAGGRLVAAKRQDAAPLISIDASAAKARTSVFFKSPTAGLTGAIQPGAPLFTLGDATGEQLAFIAGGLPLTDKAGKVIGAVGSSGGSPDQDQQVVDAAIAAL